LAYESFQKAFAQNPKNPEILKNLGKIAFEQKEYKKSISHMDEYLRIFGEDALVRAYR